MALTGIPVNDSIVLIDFINRRVEQGMPLDYMLLAQATQKLESRAAEGNDAEQPLNSAIELRQARAPLKSFLSAENAPSQFSHSRLDRQT